MKLLRKALTQKLVLDDHVVRTIQTALDGSTKHWDG